MKRVALSPVALALALGFSLIAVATCDDDVIHNGFERPGCIFMPTAVGNSWEYRVTVDSKYNRPEEYKLVYEITSAKQDYEGFPTAYVITVTQQGSPPYDVIVAPDDVTCYVERRMWAYLMEDDMVVGVWTQTGLVKETPLEYVRDINVKVPAGEWLCRELYKDNGREFKPEEWHEYYAEDVGLVKYEDFYIEYKASEPHELVDWRNEVYELVSYEIVHTETMN